MREIKLDEGRIIRVHDSLQKENVKFITDLGKISIAHQEFIKIPKGEGLVICRMRNNLPVAAMKLVEQIANGIGCEGYFWNERPDVDANPVCTELIIVK